MKGGETEQLRRDFAARQRRAQGVGCPEPAELWAGVTGGLPRRRRLELVDHLITCAACAEDWRLAREIGRNADGGAAEAVRPLPAPVLRRWALVAAAVLAVGVGVALWPGSPPSPPPADFRGPDLGEIRSLTAENVPLPKEETTLRWAVEADVASFNVRVATPDLETLSLGEGLTVPEYRIPVADLQNIPPGDRLLWQVEAILEDGSRLVSPTFVNRLE